MRKIFIITVAFLISFSCKQKEERKNSTYDDINFLEGNFQEMLIRQPLKISLCLLIAIPLGVRHVNGWTKTFCKEEVYTFFMRIYQL